MNKLPKKRLLSLITCFLISLTANAQNNSDVPMADTLRASGKIYVVVAVIAVIFIGLAIYLFTIDKKISKTERQSKKIQ